MSQALVAVTIELGVLPHQPMVSRRGGFPDGR
jgi:hypothetical protein